MQHSLYRIWNFSCPELEPLHLRNRKNSHLALSRPASVKVLEEGVPLFHQCEVEMYVEQVRKAGDLESQVAAPLRERRGALATFFTSSLLYDWIAALACLALALGLEKASPRNSYVLKETLYWNSYPLKDNTVPSWTVPLYALVGPLVLLLVAPRFLLRRPWSEVARLWAALSLSFFLTGAITNCLKLPVGRLRPNFVKTCWPSGVIVFEKADQWGGYAVCDSAVSKSDVEEVRKSWPSGHSSLSAAGLGFVTFWLLGQLRPFSQGPCWGRLWRLLVALLPSLGAVAVAVTRVLDFWHFTSDALTGLSIGFVTSFAVYQSIFPSLTHPRCNLMRDVLVAAEVTAT